MQVLLVACAVVCRCVLIWQGSGDWLAKRVEISTPVNSWSRSKSFIYSYSLSLSPPSLVQEGVALSASNYSPYSGDIFHEVGTSLVAPVVSLMSPCHSQQPLVLSLFQSLTGLGGWAVAVFFIVRQTWSLYVSIPSELISLPLRVWMWPLLCAWLALLDCI